MPIDFTSDEFCYGYYDDDDYDDYDDDDDYGDDDCEGFSVKERTDFYDDFEGDD